MKDFEHIFKLRDVLRKAIKPKRFWGKYLKETVSSVGIEC